MDKDLLILADKVKMNLYITDMKTKINGCVEGFDATELRILFDQIKEKKVILK